MSRADALRLPEYLRHILEAIERISRYVEDMDEVAFLNDPRTQDAVIRNFEIIGEASRNIGRYHSQFADEHDYLPLGFAYECRMRWRTDISRWTCRLSGRPFMSACPRCINRPGSLNDLK